MRSIGVPLPFIVDCGGRAFSGLKDWVRIEVTAEYASGIIVQAQKYVYVYYK